MSDNGSRPSTGSCEHGPASPLADDSRPEVTPDAWHVDPLDRLWSVGKRMTDPAESLAQRVAERVLDLVVHALDVNDLVRRVDLNAVLSQVDVDAVLGKVNVNAVLDRVEVNELLDRVDVNALLDRVDVDALLARADVDALVKRADLDDLLRRIDVDAVLDRVDVNDLVRRIDMDTLVEQTDLGAIIARSSGGAASEALDAARSQAVGLDQFVDRWVGRALRRKSPGPAGPPAALDGQAPS